LSIGGRQGKLPVVAFEVYDFETNRWRSLPDIPSKRVFALYTHSDTHIFSVGGLNQDPKQGFSNNTEVFDLDKGRLLSCQLLAGSVAYIH
jgi:Kelch motif